MVNCGQLSRQLAVLLWLMMYFQHGCAAEQDVHPSVTMFHMSLHLQKQLVTIYINYFCH